MKKWYAIRSKPRKEAWVTAMLARAEVETYLPMVVRRRFPGRPEESAPYFPGYIFAHLDDSEGEVHLARYTYGVIDIVGYGGEPCPLPDELIELIRERVAGLQRRDYVPFRQGDPVVISSGPLQGTEAIFDRQLSGTGRAQVLVQLLHRLCRAEVHVGQLRFFQKAAGFSRT